MAIHLITYPLWIYYIYKISLVFIISLILTNVIKKLPILKIFIGEKI
jgi:hypothetical protein